jgi:phosphate transport system substrate-binding protein
MTWKDTLFTAVLQERLRGPPPNETRGDLPVKNGTRLAALGGVVVAGALALSACGSDNNSSSSSSSGSSGSQAGSSSANCVKGTVQAAGSTAQQNAITEWTKDYQANCAGANLNYNGNGSGAGVTSFTSKQVAFAGSDSALTPQQKPAADQRCGAGNQALDIPMVVGPIAVVYNLKGTSSLNLSAKTIAGIFAGKVTSWNAPEIKADNPGASLPSTKISTMHRSDASGTTDNFTKFLTASAPDVWKFAGGKVWTAPGGQGLKGSAGIATALKQTDGSISYVEMSYATNDGLQTAKVNNVALSTDSAGVTVSSATQSGQGNDLALKIDYATKASGAYPIVLVTYEVVCDKGLPADQAKFVKSFLTYTSSSAGQAVLTKLGYAPLPPSVLTKVQQVVAGLS